MAKMMPGEVYRIVHKKKGTFIAQFVRYDPRIGDEEMVVFQYDTRRGTGQEWLARAAKAEWTETALRPSLIIEADLLPGFDWQLEAKPFANPPSQVATPRHRPWYASLRRWSIRHLKLDPVKAVQQVSWSRVAWFVFMLLAAGALIALALR